MSQELPAHLVNAAIAAALSEDLGLAGDITTNAVVSSSQTSKAAMIAREGGRLAGLPLARAAFQALDAIVQFHAALEDGVRLEAGSLIATVEGSSRAILTAERVALNFVQHLSGIATLTHRFVDTVAGTHAKIVCTRKTTPGLRALEKYAVRAGGGVNHRFGLFDAILIKDNHIIAAGGISQAISKARAAIGHLVKLEIEVDTLEQLEEVLRNPVDAVLLDNMTIPQLETAVAMVRKSQPHMICEASGGVSLDTVRAIAETGIDCISVGALTHSVANLDIGLDFEDAQ